MSVSVIAMYQSSHDAKKVVDEIVKVGFREEAIELISGSGQDRGLVGKLASHGIDRQEAELLAKAISRGGALVTLDASDEHKAEDARDIMNRFGAQDLDEIVAEFREQSQSEKGQRQKAGGQEESRESIPVVEEQVSIGTRQVLRGGVRVTSKVSEKPVEKTVKLREENVDVERQQADRKLSPEEAEKAFQEKTIEATETGEEAQVNKEARVVGEVSLRKTVEEREEQVRATERRSDVQVSEIQPQERQEKH